MWKIKQTSEFKEWYYSIDQDAQTDIYQALTVLSETGPSLGRPRVDTLKDSSITNLKELRVQSNGRPFRIFFLFGNKRDAIILIGANKAGKKRFYKEMISISEELYSNYKVRLENEE